VISPPTVATILSKTCLCAIAAKLMVNKTANIKYRIFQQFLSILGFQFWGLVFQLSHLQSIVDDAKNLKP
jgi:hypothetical protein